MAPTDISRFASGQLQLLESELQAELAETGVMTSQFAPATLQRAGVAILNLQISSQRTGFGGKTHIELEPDPALGGGDLPEHSLRVGDIVSLQELISGSARKKEKSDVQKRGVEGVVSKVTPRIIAIALEKDDVDVPGGRLWLTKLANDVTYKRMKQVMTRLEGLTDAEHSTLIRVLFGHTSPTPVPAEDFNTDIEWIDPSINESQKEAIRFALASREVALIHGPPGTGKTHTLIELILQMLKQNLRLLVCGPSNISVDNIVERLAPHKIPMIRLGHPARLLPSVLNHSLDVLTRTSEAAALLKDIRNEMDQKQASIRKTRNGRERKTIYGDMKELRQEFRNRERNCVTSLIQGSTVVLSTLHGAGGFHLKQEQFDVIIIDEASQALEAQCWVPLISAKKVILAGDHLQLPPTVKSINSKSKAASQKQAAEGRKEVTLQTTLETTLFDRLLGLHGQSIKKMLTTQYRMHEKIMDFPSKELYEGKLMAATSVRHRLLRDLPGVNETEDTSEPLVFWDTQGGDFPEKSEDDAKNKPGQGVSFADSKSNDFEAALVKLHVIRLVKAGVKPDEIAVVTPYNAQLAALSQLLKEQFPGIELGSVDGFQGREKEAIVISLVRSNTEGEVGFLSEKRRLNVAMTRPRRHLCVVGDSETVGRGSKFLSRWLEYLEANADLRYPDLNTLKIGD